MTKKIIRDFFVVKQNSGQKNFSKC